MPQNRFDPAGSPSEPGALNLGHGRGLAGHSKERA